MAWAIYAAGGALVLGVGALVIRHFSKCPSKREMAGILADIDSGKISSPAGELQAAELERNGCPSGAAAIRKLLAAKLPPVHASSSPGPLPAPPPPKIWPASDPKCLAAINALPKDAFYGIRGGARAWLRFYDLAQDAIKKDESRTYYDLSDLIEANISGRLSDTTALDFAERLPMIHKAAAQCLRDRGDEIGPGGSLGAATRRALGALTGAKVGAMSGARGKLLARLSR